VGGGGLGVVDGLDKVVVVEVVDVVVKVVDVDVVVKVVDVVVQVVDVVEEANVVDFGCFFDLFFFSLFFFFFVVDVKVLLLCHHFYFSLSFSIWRISKSSVGKALAYSHRERKRGEKKICFGKAVVPGRGRRRRRSTAAVSSFFFSLSLSSFSLAKNKLEPCGLTPRL
jgi:hypothetical protein